MTDTLRIPISTHQQARFLAFKADAERTQSRVNDALTVVIASVVDPATVQGWDIRWEGSEVVCVPPIRDESVVGQIETAAP